MRLEQQERRNPVQQIVGDIHDHHNGGEVAGVLVDKLDVDLLSAL